MGAPGEHAACWVRGGGLGAPTPYTGPPIGRVVRDPGCPNKPQPHAGQPDGAGPSGVSDAEPAQGWGCPWAPQLVGAGPLAPWGGLHPPPALQHSAGLPAPSSHLHFPTAPDKVTVYPLGFQAACTAPCSPLRLDTGKRRNATRQVCANTGAAWSPSVFSLVSKISI